MLKSSSVNEAAYCVATLFKNECIAVALKRENTIITVLLLDGSVIVPDEPLEVISSTCDTES